MIVQVVIGNSTAVGTRSISCSTVKRSHRIIKQNPPSPTRPRSIVVRFVSRRDVDLAGTKRKDLSLKSIFSKILH